MRRVIEVQELTPDDWQLWRAMRRAALAEAPAAFGSTLAEWSGPGDTEERWRARLSGVPLNLVLTVDGEPAGMVSATAPSDDGTVELISLWVAPSARGHGVADAAISRVAEWARAEHGAEVVLSVRADNHPAIALYRRHGFVDVGPSPDDPAERLMRRRPVSASA
jgi:ribosomal protein S18 acetylase RimI-like enzyme